MTNKRSTKDKILDAAEQLFALTGFAETSMRQITSKANVNLASVNYHFGSKKDLIQAVMDRYLSQFIPQLLNELNQLNNKQPDYSITQLFSCFKKPLLDLENISKHGSVFFLQMLGRGYVDYQGHLRVFITDKYGSALTHIQQSFHKTKPELTPADLFWRLHFILGTSVFTLAASQALSDISSKDFHQQMNTEQIVDELLPFLAAGFIN
ncbi:TetR/AcrR family transcriptional regulator [Psychrosphaera sp. F3M07]|jgi:AcrR family transcriptional regulator|uniref:TetR/AcrR family transcriptional regulator n=1 Tax=Psychrosphaera sp. F3M07 TaxID=2841560 RepID=UPI001C097431|nr:TetR/AcrR family transcriptional regulator [Psychrosphaera sp. F3M07]MBU2918709.1 TetR/AcrR family transcriptional regulator [Psychrosphaera sp. F3M07]